MCLFPRKHTRAAWVCDTTHFFFDPFFFFKSQSNQKIAYFPENTRAPPVCPWHDPFFFPTHFFFWKANRTKHMSVSQKTHVHRLCVCDTTHFFVSTHFVFWKANRTKNVSIPQKTHARRLCVCDMTHLYLYRDSFTYMTWLIYTCATTRLYVT